MANPFQGDDVDPFSGARDQETGDIKPMGLAKSAKTSRFGTAFAAARRSGDKTFMFNGKKYTTNLAGSKKPAAGRAPMMTTPEDDAKIFGAGAAEEGVTASGRPREARGMKKGGMVKSSASKRADGCATKGKTKGRMV
jgi:hypothetical protein